MAHFEKVPERPSFDITDDYGHCANLTAEQAYELLAWLNDRRDEMFQALHPAVKEMPSWGTPDTLQAWQRARATVEAYKREQTEREENNKEYGDEDL